MQNRPLTKTLNTMEPNMNEILYAFWMTIELWAFLGILTLALGIEELVKFYRKKTVDNPTLW